MNGDIVLKDCELFAHAEYGSYHKYFDRLRPKVLGIIFASVMFLLC